MEASVRWLAFGLSLGLVMAGGAPARAQLLAAWQACVGDAAPGAVVQINGCSEVLRSNLEPPKHRAVAVFNRGVLYQAQGALGQAVADYDQALALDPSLGPALAARGSAEFARADYARAAADYGLAIRVSPGAAEAWVGRGAARLALGQTAAGLADNDRAVALEPTSD
jgi:tetratricopeptide (TPR) repeat protein